MKIEVKYIPHEETILVHRQVGYDVWAIGMNGSWTIWDDGEGDFSEAGDEY